MGASIFWVGAEIDPQSTIFDLSALKKQLLICQLEINTTKRGRAVSTDEKV
jgi:hypothetical protein